MRHDAPADAFSGHMTPGNPDQSPLSGSSPGAGRSPGRFVEQYLVGVEK
jgi:hypothetical protein